MTAVVVTNMQVFGQGKKCKLWNRHFFLIRIVLDVKQIIESWANKNAP